MIVNIIRSSVDPEEIVMLPKKNDKTNLELTQRFSVPLQTVGRLTLGQGCVRFITQETSRMSQQGLKFVHIYYISIL